MAPREANAIADYHEANNKALLQERDPLAVKDKLRMDVIKKMIPEECFVKSLPRSLFYMARDMGVIYGLWKAYPVYVEGNWPLTFVWWNLMGFFMWCLFVVGHDCGHTTFSNSTFINSICGHLCHAPLCVPFWPWAQSHHQHHSYHNHIEKDHSFPWYRKEEWAAVPDAQKAVLASPVHPLFIYGLVYLLLGYADGSHFNPFSSLFKTKTQRVQCFVSSVAVVAFVYFMIDYVFEYNWMEAAIKYLVPWMVFNYWLVMVTYMQHHEEDTITYDDNDFVFSVAAMETVDRTYGWGIDDLHHNITDSHVVHHLFFTKMPHYQIKKATDAVRPYLESLGVYKYSYTPNFLWNFMKYNYKYGLFTHSKYDESVGKATKLSKSD